MATVSPEAEKLSARVDEVLERVRVRFSEAQTPDPAWAMYKEGEIEKRMEARRKSYLDTSKRELEDVRRDIISALDNMRKEMDSKLHPLQNSRVETEQRRGEYFEEYAHRLARTIDTKALEYEYGLAMENSRIDLGSAILEWGERFLDKEDISEAGIIEGLKSKHKASLGLDVLLASMDALRAKRKHLESRIAMFMGYGKTEIEQAEDLQELSKMLKAGGLT